VEANQGSWSNKKADRQKIQMQENAQARSRSVAEWRELHKEKPEVYHVGQGDKLEIKIFGLEEPGKPSTLDRTISPFGTIDMPWIQSVFVRGLTETEIGKKICSAYAEKYLKNANVSVTVLEYVSKQVLVTGAVEKPGSYPLDGPSATVMECLYKAGGPGPQAGDDVIVMTGDQNESSEGSAKEEMRRISLSLKDLLDSKDTSLNVEVRPGYRVVVPPSRKEFFVIGYVRSPGSYPFKSSQRVSAIEAIARAGGLSGAGRAANCFLVRQKEEGLEVIEVNMENVVSGKLASPYLLPGDGLIVGTSVWAQIGQVFSAGANVSASASVAPQ
jgi:polysaccharide export outer membrane protein